MTNQRLFQRADEYRKRLKLRSWEYRQRNLSRGVWGRLRALLADAAHVYAVGDDDAGLLATEGERPHPAGLALQPPKQIFIVTATRAAGLASRRELAVRLSM